MTQPCVNEGGAGSRIRLHGVPRLENPFPVGQEAAAALARWKARPGVIVTVSDLEGSFYRARVTELTETGAVLVPFQRFTKPAESPVSIELYQALPEKERFELILQKVTELGVTRIVPFRSRRSIALEDREAVQPKAHRWPDVVLRAACQCRRALIPELYPVLSWDEATFMAAGADLKLMLFEKDAPWTLREALRGEGAARISLLVGPEGGFEPEEAEEARGLGFLPVSIGPRILRTETAAITAAALVQYTLGDLG